MENISSVINKQTRKVYLSKSVIGNDGENLQDKLVFSFNDEFVNGTARLELNRNNTKSYIMLTKVGETYELPVKSLMTKVGKLDLQLVITEGINEDDIPIFKSNVFFVIVNPSINAEIEEEEEYPQWIDVANTKLNEIDDALDDLQEKVDSGYFKGDKGDVGPAGPTGPMGPQGIQGIQGERGLTGETGPQGERGPKGDTGSTGATGPAGPKGETGETGPAGSNGTNGVDGFSPIANVTQSGDITTISITDKEGTTTASIDLSGVGGGTTIEKITNPINLDEIEPGIYYFDNDVSSITIRPSQAGGGWVYSNPLLFIIKEKYKTTMANNYIFACLYYVNAYSLTFSNFYNSNGQLTRNQNSRGMLLSNIAQTINGEKTFNVTPKVNSYTIPTLDTQLVAKKYVDDKIGDINTILATLTTPGGN